MSRAAKRTGSPRIKEGATQEIVTMATLEHWVILKQSVGVKKEVGLNSDGSKKYEVQEVGKIDIPVPTLAAFGITAEQAKNEDGSLQFVDGLPVYADDKMDWIFGAAVAQTKVQARNKLVNSTADLKEGQKIAENFEELTAEGERKGNAEALKLAKEVQQAFAAFMGTLGKKAETVAFAANLFKNRDALASQPAGMKEKMKAYLDSFLEQLSAEDATRYARPLLKVEEACSGALDINDF